MNRGCRAVSLGEGTRRREKRMTDHITADSGMDSGDRESQSAAPPDAQAMPCAPEAEHENDRPAGPAGAAVSIELHFDESSNVLAARLTDTEADRLPTLEELEATVQERGYAEFSFQPEALEGILRRAGNGETGEFPIAVRRDAEISVGATSDRLQVLLTTSRAYGGQPVTEERLRSAMTGAGFDPGLFDRKALAAAAAGDPVNNLVVARGTAPRSGQNSRVELLVDLDAEATGPKEAGAGRVDHYSVRDFVIVEPGRRLMRRHEPTKGVAGRDVFGKVIAARDGKDLPLPKDMPGVIVDDDDPMLFLAEYKGHPVAIPGGVRVDKTLLMDYVDLRTGNIDFDGSVLVAGDVAAGVTVKASGDIVVKGTVERAFLHAGNDLLVARGITGSESAMQGGKREVFVQAENDVQIGFASGVRIRAGNNVVVKEYLNHCDVLAMGRILVGQTGGRGIIVGGCCHGCRGVSARASGTSASVVTRVRAGPHNDLSEAQRKAFEERGALKDRLAQLKEMLASMAERESTGSDERQHLMDKIRRTVDDYEARFAEADLRLDELNGDLAGAAEAVIDCTQRVYAGSIIEIGDATLAIKTEASGGRFVERDGEIVWD